MTKPNRILLKPVKKPDSFTIKQLAAALKKTQEIQKKHMELYKDD